MSKTMKYVHESLAASGFCVLNSRVAFTLRPDLWESGLTCGADLADKSLPGKLSTVNGCVTYLVRFLEIESCLIKVLARSHDRLPQRIEWITGLKVALLTPAAELDGEVNPDAIPKRNANAASGDIHAGTVTQEPGRACSSCEWASTASTCTNIGESQIKSPAMTVLRRCKGYRPRFSNMDSRTALQLWPELFFKA